MQDVSVASVNRVLKNILNCDFIDFEFIGCSKEFIGFSIDFQMGSLDLEKMFIKC